MLDTEYWMLDTEYWMLVAGGWWWEIRYQIPEIRIMEPLIYCAKAGGGITSNFSSL